MTTERTVAGHHRCIIVVPCYNEEKRLDVRRFRSYLASSANVFLLFVDDGSSDNTIQVLQQLTSGMDRCAAVLPCTKNGGKAEAVRLGFNHALRHYDADCIGFWDADLATPLESIERLLQVLENGPALEMIFGSRVQLLGRQIRRKPSRHYLGRVFATVVSLILRMPIYDSQCGAKIFRVTPRLNKVMAESFSSRWVFDVEILARYLNEHDGDAAALSKLIYEYPLEQWVDVDGSKVRPKDFLTAFLDVLKIRARYLR